MLTRLRTAAVLASLGVALAAQDADACGCFAPPDPTVPVVQAGERILFSVENGVVNAHIQIQYAGEASEFGWLLPLPSVPEMKLGTEELFTQLINTTQPRYFVNTVTTGTCGGGFGRGTSLNAAAPSAESDSAGGQGSSSPLVTQSSIGPYDYAVLRADNKDAMLAWLNANRYFIPTGTEDVVGPYIRPGAYFLALKLQSGKSAGDIQPVVLNYPSDLPMIPIILTSVAAQPNMGIQVWMLGNGRAIPRNYNHVVVNDAQIDWLNQARNYNEVIIKAVSEAPEKHAFVTEYAGTSNVMVNVLDAPDRFGNAVELAAITDPVEYVEYLEEHGFLLTPVGNILGTFQRSFPQPTRSILLAQLPVPAALQGRVSEDSWLLNLRSWRTQNPSDFATWTQNFDGAALTAQLQERVVQPAREAGALFSKYGVLTRLYTTLSPEDMNRDPVFSFNPSLPDVSRDHTATLRVDCGLFGNISTSPATLTTEQGWVFQLPNRGGANPSTAVSTTGPGALRIETLAEEGPPTILVDNGKSIAAANGCGCSSVDPLAVVGALGLFLARRRRAPRA